MENKKVAVTRLQVDFFKLGEGGVSARLIHSEVVEIFGKGKEECLTTLENGEEDVRDEILKLIYPQMEYKKWSEESSYSTLTVENLTRARKF